MDKYRRKRRCQLGKGHLYSPPRTLIPAVRCMRCKRCMSAPAPWHQRQARQRQKVLLFLPFSHCEVLGKPQARGKGRSPLWRPTFCGVAKYASLSAASVRACVSLPLTIVCSMQNAARCVWYGWGTVGRRNGRTRQDGAALQPHLDKTLLCWHAGMLATAEATCICCTPAHEIMRSCCSPDQQRGRIDRRVTPSGR